MMERVQLSSTMVLGKDLEEASGMRRVLYHDDRHCCLRGAPRLCQSQGELKEEATSKPCA